MFNTRPAPFSCLKVFSDQDLRSTPTVPHTLYMSIFQTPDPVLATGSRVTWQGIPATVIDGNEANEWRPASALVSLHLDRPVKRGYAPYADVQASSLTVI